VPIYNFLCKDCKKEFDIAVSCYDLIPKDLFCPDCKGKNIRKKFSRVGLIFKGSGFYSNDKNNKRVKNEK